MCKTIIVSTNEKFNMKQKNKQLTGERLNSVCLAFVGEHLNKALNVRSDGSTKQVWKLDMRFSGFLPAVTSGRDVRLPENNCTSTIIMPVHISYTITN